MATGSATLDFGAVGAVPVRSSAQVDVIGQAGILSNSKVEAWARLVATAEHSVDEIRIEQIQIFAGNIIAGTGFTIYGEVPLGVTYGTYTVDWVWN